ncbi:MAG: SPASM domain-containing protein, partial [Armatimonadota bacterium]
IRTRIHTNGTVLSEELSRELIVAGVGVTSFSFDGYDREMYEANRPGADFDHVLGNIVRFLEVKRTIGSRTPFVVIELMEITDLPRNQIRRKRRQFLSMFEGLPLDKFVIRRPHNWAGLIKTDLITTSGQGRIPCPLLWHALVVFWDGRVMPCPQDFFGMLQVGDTRKESLSMCWNGNPIRELRREMSKPDQIERHPCVDCDRLSRLTFGGIPIDYLGRFVSDTLFGNSWLSRILPH